MRHIRLSALIAVISQALLPTGPVSAQREDVLAIATTAPEIPPNRVLLQNWGDLLSKGGCSTPSNKLRLRMEKKYGARLVLIRERILQMYGPDRSNHDVITVGSCVRSWQLYQAEQKVKVEMKSWEACLGIELSDRPVTCPN
jgi:hypothetical protein